MEVRAITMIPVPIQDFINGTMSPVNLYVKLSEEKYVLVSKAGQKTNSEQLKTYEDKTVEYLWISRTDFSKFTVNNITVAGLIITQDKIEAKQKTQVLAKAAASVFLEFEYVGLGYDAYSHSRQVVEATVAMASAHKDINDLLLSLHDCSDGILRHSMAVSYISVLIAQAMNWQNRQTIEKLALGALLHDIGLKALPPELVAKPKIKMSYEELQLYEQHPYKGMQLLISLGIVPDDVIAVVYEHHENAIGQGYPRKLRSLKMHPLARIVALANDFCDLTIENPDCSKPRTPREAIMTLEYTMGQPHNKEAFRALQMVVNKEFAKAG